MQTNVFYDFIILLLSPFENLMTDYEYQTAVFSLTVLVASLFICGFISAIFGAMNALLANKRGR